MVIQHRCWIGAPSHICSPHGAVSEHPRHGAETF